MGTLTHLISEDTNRQIGWALLHFLWQGAAIAALLWGVLKILQKASANARYWAACLALLLMVAAPAVTFTLLNADTPAAIAEPAAQPLTAETPAPAPAVVRTLELTIAQPAESPAPSLLETVIARLEAALPYCVTTWLAGVTALSLWYLGGWCQLQRLRRIGTKSVSETVTEKTSELAQRLGIRKAVCLAESVLVQVPTVIGHLRPVILLPATALTGLDELQLQAMIAHELAHIRRGDYLVNIAQTVIEILGFYHPAVWWVSRQIRTERENACDDVAIALLQNRKEYARALFSMETLRAKQHTLALAANGAPLTHRIQRIAGKDTHTPNSGWIPSTVAVLILLILIVSVSLAAKQDPSNDPAAAMMDKQKVAAFFKDFEQALQNGDRQTVEQSLYFENEVLRQKAQPYITDMLDDNITILSSFRIIRVDQSADNTLSVFGLYPVEGKMYVTNTLPVKIENGWYQLDIFNADFFKKIERAKTQTPHQIGRNIMQEQLDEWRNADSEALNKLIQTLIDGEQNNLIAAQYAQANDLQMMPHLTIPEITQRLAGYKTTDPEQLRSEVIKEMTEQLQDNNKTQPSSSKAAPAVSAQNGQAEKMAARLQSMNHLRQLGLAYFMFRDDNDGKAPAGIEELQLYLDNETRQWVNENENVVLLPLKKDLTPAETATIPIAWDKTLLNIQNGATVLFADGHVEFLQQDKLTDYGISVRTGDPYLQGHVYDSEGKPVAGATVQIRQQREPGMTGIAAPDVTTDENGYYWYDSINWPYMVGAFQKTAWENEQIQYTQYIGESRYYEGPQTVDIHFDRPFPNGTCTLQDTVTGPDGNPVPDFIVRVENLPDWNAQPPQKKRQYSLEKRVTNARGQYALTDLPAGEHRITIRKADPSQFQKIKLESNSEVNFLSDTYLLDIHYAEQTIIMEEGKANRCDFNIEKRFVTDEPSTENTDSAGGFGGSAPPAEQIQFPKNWDEISQQRGESAANLASADPNAMRTQIYDVTDILSYPETNRRPAENLERLRQTIIQSIATSSWQDNGGQGRIDAYGEVKMLIWQTPEIHEKTQGYLQKIRDDLFKYQIAIETRVMLVTDIFLEDIGLDTSVNVDNVVESVGSLVTGPANSEPILAAMEPKPLPEIEPPVQNQQPLDDLQTNLLLRAGQARRNVKTLTAPKVMVLNGEAATLQVYAALRYMDINDEEKDVNKGLAINLLPIIQQDSDTVLLKGHIQMTDVLDTQPVEHNGKTYEIPNLQVANIPIYALIESGQTALITGPEMILSKVVETNPGLSKIPLVGRFLSNRSHVIDKQRILILIKPTLIEQQEQETPAVGALATQPGGRMMGGGFGGRGGGFGGDMKEEAAN